MKTNNTELRFFVEVDMNEEYPYRVVCFKNGRTFARTREMIFAECVCKTLNYGAKKKFDYAFALVACGAFHMDFLKSSSLKRIKKDWLIEKYNQVLQIIEAD